MPRQPKDAMDPERLKRDADAGDQAAEALHTHALRRGELPPVDAALERVRRRAEAALLKGFDLDASAIEVDGEVCLPAGCRPTTYYTASGPVRFKRRLYHRPDGSLVVPVEVRAGLVDRR